MAFTAFAECWVVAEDTCVRVDSFVGLMVDWFYFKALDEPGHVFSRELVFWLGGHMVD